MGLTTIVVSMRDRVWSNPALWDHDVVRIDRRTRWGNPFVMRNRSQEERERVVDEYRRWVTTSDDAGARWIRANVHTLRGKTLACWCYPQLCHGDVLVAAALNGLASMR